MSITGSCLCGAVRYELDGPPQDAGNCHCSMCRKAHGSAFATYATLEARTFRWLVGEEYLAVYDSSPSSGRIFCKQCGSSLGTTEHGKIESIALGTVDGDPGVTPRSHIFMGSKAPWYEVTDDLPQFEAMPPGDGWA